MLRSFYSAGDSLVKKKKSEPDWKESSYVNTVITTQPPPHCRDSTGDDENLLALDVRTLGSSKSEKGQITKRR
jgi:hypothetical protein